jgi:hypothetical protein
MGYEVTSAVYEHSRHGKGKLHVLLAIAEKASNNDGVAFGLDQGWESGKKVGRRKRKETLAGKTRLNVSTVAKLLTQLAGPDDDELEVRTVQKGKERTFVYRVILGIYRDLDVDTDVLERYQQLVDRPFSTPEELALPWAERPANLPGRNERDDLTFSPLRPAISSATTSGKEQVVAPPPISGARGNEHGPRTVPNPSLTSPPLRVGEVPTPADAADGEQAGDSSTRELIRAFAQTLGRWPETRQEWAGWTKAFKPLAEAGVDPVELAAACKGYLAYHQRVGHGEIDLTPFGLTKHWQIVNQALERRFFAWMKWASEISWRLPEDEVEFLLDQAAIAIRDGDHTEIVKMAARARAAHTTPADELLVWVDAKGWSLDDDDWRRELHERLPRVGAPELRRVANHRRHELRRDLARLRAGLALPREEEAA